MKTYNVNIDNIDYELLKKQKQFLINAIAQTEGEGNEALNGILNLLDTITDQIINNNPELEEKDLFEDYANLPEEVKEILTNYDSKEGYEGCANLVKELEKVGYTCDYYLDADPYNLRKL